MLIIRNFFSVLSQSGPGEEDRNFVKKIHRFVTIYAQNQSKIPAPSLSVFQTRDTKKFIQKFHLCLPVSKPGSFFTKRVLPPSILAVDGPL